MWQLDLLLGSIVFFLFLRVFDPLFVWIFFFGRNVFVILRAVGLCSNLAVKVFCFGK